MCNTNARVTADPVARAPDDVELLQTWLNEAEPSATRERAFAAVYARYAKGVFACARGIAGAGTADDVTQEVFLTLKDHARDFCDLNHTNLGAYLHRVTFNKATDHSRRAKSRTKNEQKARAAPDGGPDGATAALNDEGARRVENALAGLSRPEQLLVDLKTKLQLTDTDAARVLGVTSPTISLRMKKLRTRLYKAFGVTLTGQERTYKPAGDSALRAERAVQLLEECVVHIGKPFQIVVSTIERAGIPMGDCDRLAVEFLQDAVIASFEDPANEWLTEREWQRAVLRSALGRAAAHIAQA
jgi:RNA polymerase sigma-70 factor (ECF subfamily)